MVSVSLEHYQNLQIENIYNEVVNKATKKNF